MIDPQHSCSWSWRKLTELQFADSKLSGAGVSLHVISHAFADKGLVWFSTVYGEFDDNMLLLAVDRATADGLERNKHHEASPLENAFGRVGAFEEYQLSPIVQNSLGIVVAGADHTVKSQNPIRYRLYIHDDCFFLVQPTDSELLRALIHCILQQHSFYLGTEIDWTNIIETVIDILSSSERVRLQSKSRDERLVITKAEHEESFMRWFLRREPLAVIKVRDGEAQLESREQGA